VALLIGPVPIAALQNQIDVIAQVNTTEATVDLFTLPDRTQAPISQVNDGTFVTIVGRDNANSWFNVQVPGGMGGWLPAEQLSVINRDFQPAQVPLITMNADTILSYSLLWNFESNHTLIIFQRGRASGKNLNDFTKVGDSITASRNYLYPFGAGVYDLQAYPHLAHVLEFFGTGADSSFNHDSIAVRNGWSTRDVLSERRALQRGCPAGTTPLTCEYDNSQPAFALIMLGTNDATAMNADEYEANLSVIIQTTLDYDIVPVLFTVPPLLRPEYDVTPFNHAVIRLSQRYDVPMVNYWLAVQSLPNYGISSDLVHPSAPPSNAGATLFTPEYLQYGYTVRNLITLQGLDQLLRYTVYPTFG